MKNTETTQPQRPAVALAEPKDEVKTVMNDPDTRDTVVAEVLSRIPYTARYQKKILAEALGKVNVITAKIDELLKMEPLIRSIYEGLDIKTKTVICVLQTIAEVEGVTNDIKYGGDILYNRHSNESLVERALEELPDDKDIAVLSEAYDLAHFVSRDGEPEPSGTTETTDKESIVDKTQDDTESAESADVVQNEALNDEDPADIVRQWLLGQSYTTKLACTILSGYSVGDHNTEKIADEVYNQYRNEIAAKSKNRDESLSFEETLMTGIATELEVWRGRF